MRKEKWWYHELRKMISLLGYPRGAGPEGLETYSPSWIPRMAGPEGLEIQQNSPAYPLLGCHEWQGQKGIQITLLLNQVQVVSDPISTKLVHKLNGLRDLVKPSEGFSSPFQCVIDNLRVLCKCWQYFTRNSKCLTRRSKPSIFPILMAALASLNILRPISPMVCWGIPKGSRGVPWITVCNNIPMETISLAVSTMEMISASADDKAGTSCFLEKNLMQHPL